MTKFSRNIWFLLWVMVILSSLACSRDRKQEKSDKKNKSSFFSKTINKKEKSVSVLTPGTREIPVTIKTSGKTEVSEKYEVKAPAEMKVLKVFVEEGARVQAGDPLVQFDDETIKLKLNLVRSESKEAEAALANINYLIQNKDQLLQEGKISEAEAEGFDERLNWYQATEERTKAEIDLYEHSGDLSQINSPIAGIVTSRNIDEGVSAAEDQQLLEVVRMDPLHFVFSVSTDEAAALSKIQSVAIRFPMIPNQEFTGELVSVGAEAKAEVGGLPVKFKVANADFALKGDMVGDVLVRTQATKKAFVVPENVLKKSDKSFYVFKVDDGKTKKTFVELAEPPANGSALIVKGLVEKDAVVAFTEAEDEIRDGDVVQVQPVPETKVDQAKIEGDKK